MYYNTIMTEHQPSEDPLLRTADPRKPAPHGIRVKPDRTLETDGNYFPIGTQVRVDFNGKDYLAAVQGDRFSTPPRPDEVNIIQDGDRVLYARNAGWDASTSPWLRENLIKEVRQRFQNLPGMSA